MTPRTERRRNTEMIVILGALTAFTPLSVDMYLPALPALETEFHTTTAAAQRTLTAFFAGFALGQLFYGPLSDRYGRKLPLYVSLSLFAIASAACALAPDVATLSGARFMQAFGACAGAVIARAVVRDAYPPERIAEIYSLLILVMGVAPMLAPLMGGALMTLWSWHAIFWALALLGALSLLLVRFRLRETLPRERRSALSLRGVLRGYGRLLAAPTFLLPALIGGCSMAGMFAYIAGSPFLFIERFGFSETQFAWFFGANAMGLIAVSQINGRIAGANPARPMLAGIGIQVLASAGLLLAAVNGWGPLGLIPPLFVFVACLGLVFPNATALAMMSHGKDAGIASALMGTVQASLAALSTFLIGPLESSFGGAWPMVGVIVAWNGLALLLALGRSQSRRPPAPAKAAAG